ncbi:MFS general substrate transporter [Astrocystis sublimbata]|nr:MFS general substrate transporter [Astrocystis sublimbata]
METTMLQALVQVESNSLPQAPRRVVSRTYPAVPHRDENIELKLLTKLSQPPTPASSGFNTPREERDLEMSVPGTPAIPRTPELANAFEIYPSLVNPRMNIFRFIACCSQTLLGGLTDSAPGALIPYMERQYHIGYAVVSLIFIGNALGFIVAAPFVDAICLRLGRAKTGCLASILVAIGFVPLVMGAPFPSIVVGYFFIGWGSAVTLAIGNVFTANLQNGTILLGILHGTYGIGGTFGPLIATSVVSNLGPDAWNRYYLLSISFAVVNAVSYLCSFWNYENEATSVDANPSHQTATPTNVSSTAPRAELSAMFRAFKSRIVLLGATFIFAYQGAEVSISGWVISFLIATRNGDPSSVGNVTSGFWGGITLGRFALSPIGARLVGEKRFVYFLTAGAAVFQLLVWFVPNIIGEAVSLAIVGLLLGPVYPCAATVFTRNLSRQEQVSGLGIISAFGSSGGAVAPFTTGLLAQAAGTFVLHPIAIGLFGAMMVCWFAIPAGRKRHLG